MFHLSKYTPLSQYREERYLRVNALCDAINTPYDETIDSLIVSCANGKTSKAKKILRTMYGQPNIYYSEDKLLFLTECFHQACDNNRCSTAKWLIEKHLNYMYAHSDIMQAYTRLSKDKTTTTKYLLKLIKMYNKQPKEVTEKIQRIVEIQRIKYTKK